MYLICSHAQQIIQQIENALFFKLNSGFVLIFRGWVRTAGAEHNTRTIRCRRPKPAAQIALSIPEPQSNAAGSQQQTGAPDAPSDRILPTLKLRTPRPRCEGPAGTAGHRWAPLGTAGHRWAPLGIAGHRCRYHPRSNGIFRGHPRRHGAVLKTKTPGPVRRRNPGFRSNETCLDSGRSGNHATRWARRRAMPMPSRPNPMTASVPGSGTPMV